jgi:hypothetical protein
MNSATNNSGIILLIVFVVLIVFGISGYFIYKSTKACPDNCSDKSCDKKVCTTCDTGYGVDASMTPDKNGSCPSYTWSSNQENTDISGSGSIYSDISGVTDIDTCKSKCDTDTITNCIGVAFDSNINHCFLKDVPTNKYCTIDANGITSAYKGKLSKCTS